MQIWVDADACPGAIKEILFRAAERLELVVTLVANRMLRTPPSRFVRAWQVPRGFDVADQRIVAELAAGDLVVTADIPLAAEAVALGARVLGPRGEVFDEHTVAEALKMRNFMQDLRDSGVETGGPAAFGQADTRAFARALEAVLPRPAAAGGRSPAG